MKVLPPLSFPARATAEGEPLNEENTSLRLLIVEDSEDDVLLVVRELRRAKYSVTFERVDTADAMSAALSKQSWDLVIADYNMPKFNGMFALDLLQQNSVDIPFIIVSGSIGEDKAVAAMKAGAHDYVMKHNLQRLVPSIQRELREAAVRQERKQAIEALQESEARKRAILESALDAIITIDHQAKILEFNRAAEKTFGYARDQIIGQSMAVLFTPRFPGDAHDVDFALYLARGGEGFPIDRRINTTAVRANGDEFPAEVAVTRISRRSPMMFTAYVRDLTEQRAQEEIRRRSEELEEQNRLIGEANRLKSEFLSNMSHELRTPLNAVIGFSQLIADGKTGPLTPEQSEYINDIMISGQHLLQLINDVLDLAKVEAGKMELHPEMFSVNQAIDEVCTMMKPIAVKKNITIKVDLARGADQAMLDLLKFKQIIYNLMSNAVKFSHDGGEIEVIARLEPGKQLCLQVKDQGVGIREEDLPRLFREFEQIDSGSARRYQGTGLGLALSKRIVELQNGSITVDSKIGQGSTFTVTIPLSPDAQKPH